MNDKEIVNLVKKAKGNDTDAFTELMNFYMKDMYRTAIAILMNDEDAADAIQDTILACWEKLRMLREIKLFKTWMGCKYGTWKQNSSSFFSVDDTGIFMVQGNLYNTDLLRLDNILFITVSEISVLMFRVN